MDEREDVEVDGGLPEEREDVGVEEGIPAGFSGELRHKGQVAFILSHSSTQSAWK